MSAIISDPVVAVPARDKGARNRRLRRKAVSYAILLLFAAFYVGPLLMLVSASLKSLPEFFRNPTGWPDELRFSNFSEAWELASFPKYMLNSLIYTTVATALGSSDAATTIMRARGGPAPLDSSAWRVSTTRRGSS